MPMKVAITAMATQINIRGIIIPSAMGCSMQLSSMIRGAGVLRIVAVGGSSKGIIQHYTINAKDLHNRFSDFAFPMDRCSTTNYSHDLNNF